MRRALVPLLALLLIAAWAGAYLPYLPTAPGLLDADWGLWLPNLLAGAYWHARNGLLALPWFSPAFCGGVPFFADPELPYLSLPQFLAFGLPPLIAIQLSTLLYAAAGFAGAWFLARHRFALSAQASLLAATIFLFNGFYATRMLSGHLPFQPFMLLPVLAAAALPDRAAFSRLALLPIAAGGLALAIIVQGGGIHIVIPCLLAALMLIAMRALAANPLALRPALFRLAAVGALALALSAGKLVHAAAWLAHFPREQYSLPGIPGLAAAFWIAFRTIFFGPPPRPETILVNSHLIEAQHEWEFGIGIAPLLLLLAAAALALRDRKRPARPWLAAALAGLCCIPVLANWYEPHWNAWLKSLPLLSQSSTLLRWFASYALPGAIAAGLALDRLDARIPGRHVAVALAAACIGLTVLGTYRKDLAWYGPGRMAMYGPAQVEHGWWRAQSDGVPPVTRLVVRLTADGKPALTMDRDDALVFGYSQLYCLQPVFGYHDERMPRGRLRTTDMLATADDHLNVKNPACYLFPQANGCAPGEEFRAGQIGAARAFLDYRPFPFERPWWAAFCRWLSLLAFIATLAASAFALYAGRRAARA